MNKTTITLNGVYVPPKNDIETIDILGKQYEREMTPSFIPALGVYPEGLLLKEVSPDDIFNKDICQRLNESISESICANRIDGDVCNLSGNKCDDYEALMCTKCIEP